MGYPKELYVRVTNDLFNLRADNDRRLSERKKVAYLKNPRLKEIEVETADLCSKLAALAFGNETNVTQKTAEAVKKSDALISEKKQILKELKLPPDYLSLQYTCSLCKDTGIYKTKYCRCFEERLAKYTAEQSVLKNVLETQDFEHFDFSYYSKEIDKKEGLSPYENMKEIVKVCFSFTQDFNTSSENLLMYGGAGLGKTFLSSCIAKELMASGKYVFYQTASKIFSIIEDFKFGKTKDETLPFIIDRIYSCDLLIIDDLGAEMPTAFTASTLFDIINSRIISGKKTVISTNIDKAQMLEMYSDRVVSRVNGHYTPLKFFGNDIRVLKLYK